MNLKLAWIDWGELWQDIKDSLYDLFIEILNFIKGIFVSMVELMLDGIMALLPNTDFSFDSVQPYYNVANFYVPLDETFNMMAASLAFWTAIFTAKLIWKALPFTG